MRYALSGLRHIAIGTLTIAAGGNSVAGQVRNFPNSTMMPAPQGGLLVTASSDNIAVVVPPTISIPQGATSGSFTLTSTAVTSPVTATLTFRFDHFLLTRTIVVNPSEAGPHAVHDGATPVRHRWCR